MGLEDEFYGLRIKIKQNHFKYTQMKSADTTEEPVTRPRIYVGYKICCKCMIKEKIAVSEDSWESFREEVNERKGLCDDCFAKENPTIVTGTVDVGNPGGPSFEDLHGISRVQAIAKAMMPSENCKFCHLVKKPGQLDWKFCDTCIENIFDEDVREGLTHEEIEHIIEEYMKNEAEEQKKQTEKFFERQKMLAEKQKRRVLEEKFKRAKITLKHK